MTDEHYMKLAIKEAKKSIETHDVPIGCVIVKDGKIIAKSHNEKEKHMLATDHAEMIAIKKASAKIKHWRLHECTLYVTLEPCSMCAGAIINSRISRVVFGAYDKERGALSSKLNLGLYNLECSPKIDGGIYKDECAKLLSDFFSVRTASSPLPSTPIINPRPNLVCSTIIPSLNLE